MLTLRQSAALIVSLSFLFGCGSDDSGDSSIPKESISPKEMKASAKEVLDEETGIAYQQIEVEEGSEITILVGDDVFTLTSNSEDNLSEKLVVKGNLTIK